MKQFLICISITTFFMSSAFAGNWLACKGGGSFEYWDDIKGSFVLADQKCKGKHKKPIGPVIEEDSLDLKASDEQVKSEELEQKAEDKTEKIDEV